MTTQKLLATRLRELAVLFFRLGATAFGGPAAEIAMTEDEVVDKRGWMTREHFLDLVGVTNLIPGPNATEMAIHCGYHYAGVPGLIVAGLSFVLPATAITIFVAWLYVRYGTLPAVEPFIAGVRPAVLAIIVGAILRLGQKALKRWELGVIGVAVTGAVLLGLREIYAILGGGLVGMLWLRLASIPSTGSGTDSTGSANGASTGSANGASTGSAHKKSDTELVEVAHVLPCLASTGSANGISIGAAAGALTGAAITATPLGQLFLVFLKVGAILFGSGYVLVAYLEDELVTRLGWLTQAQLLDAIAVGQFTPGPLLTSSSFVGYVLQGLPGALVATAGIILPSFIFVLIANPLVPKLRESRWASAVLDAVNISAVGLMAATGINLTGAILVDWRAVVIALASTAVLFLPKKRIQATWVVFGGALLGYLLGLV